jgi:hypothetical protein
MEPPIDNYVQYMKSRFGDKVWEKAVNITRNKHIKIWKKTEDIKLLKIVEQLLQTEFNNIFSQFLLKVQDQYMMYIYSYYTDISNFRSYRDWYQNFYDELDNIENHTKNTRTTNFRLIINKFDTLYQNKKNELYKQQKKFIKTAMIMVKVKYARSLHLFTNRYYHKIFSFHNVKFLKLLYVNRDKHINNLNAFYPSGDFNKDECKYLLLAVTTLKKGPFGFAHFIGCVLNRLLCKDIALYVCDFI